MKDEYFVDFSVSRCAIRNNSGYPCIAGYSIPRERFEDFRDTGKIQQASISLSEITRHFDFDRSSIFRLLGTLMQNNFVHQDPETKKYMLGFKIMELSGAFGEQTSIEKLLCPILKNRLVAKLRLALAGGPCGGFLRGFVP